MPSEGSAASSEQVSHTGSRGATPVEGAATLVIGATGILRPAALKLVSLGIAVVAVGRNPQRLASLKAASAGMPGQLIELRADASVGTFAALLDRLLSSHGLRLESALVYSPATSSRATDELMRRWRPRLVEILTSRFAEPVDADRAWTVEDLPDPPDARRRLVLGWQLIDGRPAWHTPVQISAAALAGLELPGDRVLGMTSPWSDRP